MDYNNSKAKNTEDIEDGQDDEDDDEDDDDDDLVNMKSSTDNGMDSYAREVEIRHKEYSQIQDRISGPIKIIKVGDDQYFGLESPMIKPSSKKLMNQQTSRIDPI